ncbi:MAG: T9SS type A sorting domain-containing protein [Bacteroidales bacterium]|nr:T9SS type A sorting domain-containing protein [Bacteroidales bacterium]
MKRLILVMMLVAMALFAISQPVTITPPAAFIEPGESVQLTATGALYYRWSPAAWLSTTEGPVTVASPEVTTTYTCSGFAPGAESVVNGNFDQGNVGFTSDYEYNSNLWAEGTYYVDYDASLHHENFQGLGHGDSGNFMIVNGATIPGTNVWTEQITVNPGSYYAFSTWVCSVGGSPDQVALLQFSINGTQIGDVFAAPPTYNGWKQFYVLWYSENWTTATITILNQNTGGDGNDFGLDDISFSELVLVGEPQCTVHVDGLTASAYADETELCNGQSTILHAEVSGGHGNYTYSWTPANTLDDPTSAHPVATPPVGNTTYTCHVSDGYDNKDVDVTLLVFPPNDTTLVDPSICFGQTYDFHGANYDEDGQIAYFDTIDNHGCLKVEKLVLTIDEYQRPPVVMQFECYAHGTMPSWYWDKTGTTYHEDTYDEIVLDDPEGGCPILHRLDLKFHEEYYHEESKTACNEFYWPITGVTYMESQEGMTHTFHNAFGDQVCDSTYVLNLTIANYETSEEFVPYEETCDSYFWDPAGHAYVTEDEYDPENHVFTVSGTYQRTYQNQMGCDSIVTMQVDFDYQPHPAEITAINSTNTVSHWVITATEFQINSYDFTMTDINPDCHWDTVVWSCDDAPQWVLEPFGEIGENCKLYVLNREPDTVWLRARAFNRCASEDGVEQKYWLLSSFYGVDEYGPSSGSGTVGFNVLPNPNKGRMTFAFENLTGKIDVKVYDMTGNLLDHIQTFNGLNSNSLPYEMRNCADGIYFFVATGKEGSVAKKVIVQR